MAIAPFERDIILADDEEDGGKVYHITQENLAKMAKDGVIEEVDLGTKKYQLIKQLLEQGVTGAAIPTRTGTQADFAFCYLINLAALKTSTKFED